MLIIISGCNRSSEITLEPTPFPPLKPVFPSAIPPPLYTDTPPALPTVPPESLVSPPADAVDLSTPLFIFADKAVWIIRPGEMVIQRLTPPALKVTCFDIWPGDNRLAYGTDTGQVYLISDTSSEALTSLTENEPEMLFDAFPEAPYLVRMDSLSWSSDGRRLAFTVDYSTPGASLTAGYPSSPSGLWLFELANLQATWIESNHYLGPNQSDPSLVRRLSVGNWAPDNSGLLVHTTSREGSDLLILDLEDSANLLVDPPGEYWSSASWKRDSQAVLLSGNQASTTSNLVQVQGDGSNPLVLINGETDKLYVYDATELPGRIAFLGTCGGCTLNQAQLYIGHQTGTRFVYNSATIHQYCQSGAPRHIQWEPTGQMGALDCGQGELRVLLFQADNQNELDFSAYLDLLGGAEVLKLAWGGN
jgi:hypothetical protein